MNIIRDNDTLKHIAKSYNLDFCKVHKYYDGNAYTNNKGENLPRYFELGRHMAKGGYETKSNRVFKLQYFDGCFNPFLVEVPIKNLVYFIETGEPVFECKSLRPKWDTNKYAKFY